MINIVAFLILLSLFPKNSNSLRTCTPKSRVLVKDKICQCNNEGQWAHKNCQSADRQPCQTGDLIFHGCNRCVCQEDQFLCSEESCSNQTKKCIPGTLHRHGCNVCRCPDTGFPDHKLCTNTNCTQTLSLHKLQHLRSKSYKCTVNYFTKSKCYYCVCAANGTIDESNCLELDCIKGGRYNYTRDTCIPGQIIPFCTACLCPRSGMTSEEHCTESCSYESKVKVIERILSSTQHNSFEKNLLRNETAASQEVCIPGEEYIDGCKLCLCPAKGLRSYAVCSSNLCKKKNVSNSSSLEIIPSSSKLALRRSNGDGDSTECMTYNISSSDMTARACTVGSMYIIKCQQCICPYAGNINLFCRNLPENVYCEKAFPDINYVSPVRRRNYNDTKLNDNILPLTVKPFPASIVHKHTRYECDREGKYIDDCFVCECEKGSVIAEHCFRNNNTRCENATPTFIA